MKDSIGKKIKELRLKTGLTQKQLAEPDMTKGMLSHIENGNANPSLKNLEYLAEKLGSPLGYFFGDGVVQEMDEEKQNELVQLIKNVDEYMSRGEFKESQEKLMGAIETGQLEQFGRLRGDILERLGRCKFKLGLEEESEKYLIQASNAYQEQMMFQEAAEAYFLISKRYFREYHYEKAWETVKEGMRIYSKSLQRDIFFEIKCLMIQPSIYFAMGDFNKALDACNKALELSRENRVYYMLDDVYRVMGFIYLIREEYDPFLKCMDKGEQYIKFTENRLNMLKLKHVCARGANNMGNHEEAFNYLEEFKEHEWSNYYFVEKGKTHYLLGEFEEALDCLKNIKEEKPAYIADCIYFITGEVYKGLAQVELRNTEEGIETLEKAFYSLRDYAREGYEGISYYAGKEMKFAGERLSEIFADMGEQKKAYGVLKEVVKII